MDSIYIWIIAYVIPAAFARALVFHLRKWDNRKPWANLFIVHFTLLTSVITSQYLIRTSGIIFPWDLNVLPISMAVLGMLVAYLLIGTLGVWYAFSALVQQATLLSVTFILLRDFSLPLVLLLIVPIFTVAHYGHAGHGLMRSVLVLCWGCVSVVLFALTNSIWIVVALHSTLGTFLIKRSVLYPAIQSKLRQTHE